MKAKLVLVGDGPDRNKVSQMCREYGICDDVLLVGKLKNPTEVLSIADLFMLPSEQESFGLAALEAMAAALPVIVTKESGLPIIDHMDGIQITSKNEESIVNAILELNDNFNLRKKLGENAAEKIINNYNWNTYTDQVKKVYAKILGIT